MAQEVLLLVKYGSDSIARIRAFRHGMMKSGWECGAVDGTYRKNFDLTVGEIKTKAEEEVDGAANQAEFGKTCCELIFISEENRFCWDWNTP